MIVVLQSRFLNAFSLFVIGCLAGAPLTVSAIRVIEEEAIPFTSFLSKTEFDQRFPGELVEELSELESGWYVIYEHEALSYYFGPILLESTGRDYLGQLREIVGDAVAERPSIEGFRLELSYEPNTEVGNSTPSAEESGMGSSSSGATNPEPQPTGIWGFFRRLFGF